MNTTWTLTKSAIKMFVRNKQSLFFTLFMPVIIMSIFGVVGFDRTPKINVGIVTGNPSAETQQFVDQLKQVSVFNITTGSLDVLKSSLQKGEESVVIEIPDKLIPSAADIIAATPKPAATTAKDKAIAPAAPVVPAKPNLPVQNVTVWQNVGQAQQASTAITILNQILDQTTLAINQAQNLFSIQTQSVNAQNIKYIDFLLPGIIAMAVMQMSVFSVAFVFADYKEKGILKRLIATPMRPMQFVTANVITRLIVALVQTAILMGLGLILFKAHVVGSIFLVFLISFLGGIMFLGLGFTISGIAKTVESVPAIANLIVFPMLFLSGIFFPTDAMPHWLHTVVQYLPLTYFATAMRDVMANGFGFMDIWKNLAWMAGWAVVLVTLSNFTFGFEEKRQ